MANNVNNRITSTNKVWIVVHEDHYFKHLFYDMTLTYSYVGKDMVGVNVTFHDQYQKSAHEINVNLKEPSRWDNLELNNKLIHHMFRLHSAISYYLGITSNYHGVNQEKMQGCWDWVKDNLEDAATQIMFAANSIASYDSIDPEIDSKLNRLSAHLCKIHSKDDYIYSDILYIKVKASDYTDNIILDNRDEEYKSRQKTSFGSEAKAKEILGVDNLQDPLVKARSIGPNNKELLDIKDLTFSGDEDFVDENMPKCIRYPILEALRNVDMRHYGFNSITKFQAGIPQIGMCRGKAINKYKPHAFTYNAIIELCDIIRPKDIKVFQWKTKDIDIVVLQIGSWLVTAEENEGVVVYGDDHKEYKLKLLLTKYLADNALRWDEFFKVQLPDEKKYDVLSEFSTQEDNLIGFEVMTGTEYICKCGKPKDIKMCFAVDKS